jgi:hypothetical protein
MIDIMQDIIPEVPTPYAPFVVMNIDIEVMKYQSDKKKMKCNNLRFYVPLKNFSLIWRRHHCR